MARRVEYVINGPPSVDRQTLQPLQKPLAMRREQKATPTDLRTLYRHSGFDGASAESDGLDTASGVPATPVLPPTPPTVSYEAHAQETSQSSGVVIHRPSTLTPAPQRSPPTPDNTPPRDHRSLLQLPVLSTQRSLVSTYAGSFKTAVEDFASDNESLLLPDLQHPKSSTSLPDSQFLSEHRPELSAADQQPTQPCIKSASPAPCRASNHTDQLVNSQEEQEHILVDSSGVWKQFQGSSGSADKGVTRDQDFDEGPKAALHGLEYAEHIATPSNLNTGSNLREDVKVDEQFPPSTSAEKLASILGWRKSVDAEPKDYRRISGISTTSTIGALIFETTPPSGRRSTLRKTAKNVSLRSASSPLPDSVTASRISSNPSPPRLVRKRARLSNENRLSFSSEPLRPYNVPSSTVSPKIEVIKVAFISDRSASQHYSAENSRSQSVSEASNKTQISHGSGNVRQEKQTPSELQSHQAPVDVPLQSSSQPVPTSRSTSRADSTASITLRAQRQEAEKDLRRTLDRMESDRLLSSIQRLQQQPQPPHHRRNNSEISESNLGTRELVSADYVGRPATVSNHHLAQMSITGEVTDPQQQAIVTTGISDWAELRAPSVLYTPFSQSSFQSASPEINEATAVSIFPHNNHSVQIIESNLAQESRAVQSLRRDQYTMTQSPLQNPRPPPQPPRASAITIRSGIDADQQRDSGQIGSTKRSTLLARTDSLTQALGSGMSLKNAKNRKASQDLDSSLHPFWRPRPFWDGVDGDTVPTGAEQDRSVGQEGSVNNSLGFAQPINVLTGPVSFIRHISQRRRRNKAVEKKRSQSSITPLRASQKLYKNSLLGNNLKLMGVRELHQRIFFAKQWKEDERRERRRAALRESIGTNIISQGDSRFPATSSGFIRA